VLTHNFGLHLKSTHISRVTNLTSVKEPTAASVIPTVDSTHQPRATVYRENKTAQPAS